jgi:YggT family protein
MVAEANPVANLICLALSVFAVILLVRVVVSWLEVFGVRPPVTGPLKTAYQLLFDVTEPVLTPLRRVVPPAGMFDLSVLVAFVVIFVAQSALCS